MGGLLRVIVFWGVLALCALPYVVYDVMARSGEAPALEPPASAIAAGATVAIGWALAWLASRNLKQR